MTNVLVTGCTGFIGSNLTIKLVNEGYNVYGLVRHASKKNLASLDMVLDRVRLITGDLTAYHSVVSAINAAQPEYVMHLGALTPVSLSFENPFSYVSINFEGTVNIVHAILEKAPRTRLVHASTAEVYGWQGPEPIKETAPLNPASPYAVSKEAADQYVRMAMNVYGLKATVLRPNNSYGRCGERGYLVEYLISSMLSGKTCYVGAPDSVRDYMFVDDHVNAYLSVILSEKPIGEVFNVSPGNPVANRELSEIIKEEIGFEGKIVYGSYPPGYPQRPASWDPKYFVLDSAKIREALGWKPSVTLKEGLAKTIKSWRNLKYS